MKTAFVSGISGKSTFSLIGLYIRIVLIEVLNYNLNPEHFSIKGNYIVCKKKIAVHLIRHQNRITMESCIRGHNPPCILLTRKAHCRRIKLIFAKDIFYAEKT